jgi:antagonist of KipI
MKILKPGILSTIQDAGRYGYRAFGIGPGGVMDVFAFTMLNRLLENHTDEAVIEMHFPAAELLFEEDTVFAVTGGDFDARLNDESIQSWKTYRAGQGDILRFHSLRKGYRVYFSVKGGFHTDSWLDSCSTHLKIQKGGYHGRALKKEDVLILKNKEANILFRIAEVPSQLIDVAYNTTVIHCMEGPEFEKLTDESKNLLFSEVFTIDLHANRMGYRLEQKKLVLSETPVEMLSSAVCMGTIQLAPDGGLIILMADHQTTGGYPRVLTVISAELPKLAQHKPGDQIKFKLITVKEAEEKYVLMYQQINDQLLNEKLY